MTPKSGMPISDVDTVAKKSLGSSIFMKNRGKVVGEKESVLERHRRERIPIRGAPPRLSGVQEGIRRSRTWSGFLPLRFHSVRIIERRDEWVHQRALVEIIRRGFGGRLRLPCQIGMQRSTRTRGEVVIRIHVHVRDLVLRKRRRGWFPHKGLCLDLSGRNTRRGGNAPRHLGRHWPIVSIVKGRREVT